MNEDIKIKGNEEIEEALKEFEKKSREEQQRQVIKTEKASELPKMVQLVIKCSGGLVKEQRQAEYVLLGLVVLMFALSFYFFFRGDANKSPPLLKNIPNINQPQFMQ